MGFRDGCLHAFQTLAAMAAGALMVSTPAAATTPLLLWNDVSRIAVHCLVVPDPAMAATRALQSALCDRVRTLAARGAPAPVVVVGFADPALIAPGTAVILVHASVEPAGRDGRLLAFSIRPFRVSAEQTSTLFGAAPRAAKIPVSGVASAALDKALGAALSETLPWLARPEGPRIIR
ncbi:hypothetical protein [Sphingosinicella sp. LY1275]|uniref:hypothetical protein n=1 Tax=Sphingosinicella sp. LY1275 TaxID=3095379 RepID=UPI002ADED730|nr:hypothetical protein [Sphingosinicella sp. LY1275]MEA1014822.1 hypothetical protein [Sphingosinicella sp. LY1275]